MKVLCLHGRGTSGAIFKSQTSSIRSRLADLNLDFDFLDGPYPCTPAPGIDLFYPPPYYSYYEESPPNTTLASLQKTHTWLASVIAERGPYDLVLSFSQGCALAASMLLFYELTSQAKPKTESGIDGGTDGGRRRGGGGGDKPPFKSAIFICGGPPLPLLESIGYHIPPRTKARDLASRSALASMANSTAILSRGSARWTPRGLDFSFACTAPDTGLANVYGTAIPSSFTIDKEDEIRREMAGPVQIGVPTVHIYGERDPRYIAGIQLSEICVKGKRKVYNHGGGHEIPRFEAVSRAIADLVRWAVWAANAEAI